MQYTIISEESLYTLMNKVREHLNSGWELQGGVSVAMSMSCQEYCQAMVKEGII